jgi:excisionase family DNA binding protein
MKLITAKELASAWQMPLARVYELARAGALPVVRIGERQLRFDEAALREWVARGGSVAARGKSNEKQK